MRAAFIIKYIGKTSLIILFFMIVRDRQALPTAQFYIALLVSALEYGGGSVVYQTHRKKHKKPLQEK